MNTRICYWYSPQGVFEEKEFSYWSDEATTEIPNRSFVYDPSGIYENFQYGRVVEGHWCHTPYEEVPNEFKAYLLLVGAHVNG